MSCRSRGPGGRSTCRPAPSPSRRRKVSTDAGEWVHWSGNGRSLYWTPGAAAVPPRPRDAAGFAPAPSRAARRRRRSRSASPPTPRGPSGMLALTGARIVTMRGDEVIENGTVLIDGNRIAAVGPTAAVSYPGRHADHRRVRQDHHPRPDRRPLARLDGRRRDHPAAELGPLSPGSRYGVTTVHDPSNDTSEIFAASELQKAGLIARPPHLLDRHDPVRRDDAVHGEIDSLDDARAHLRRLKASGAWSVKSYNQPRRDQRQQIIAGRARARHGRGARRRLAVRVST